LTVLPAPLARPALPAFKVQPVLLVESESVAQRVPPVFKVPLELSALRAQLELLVLMALMVLLVQSVSPVRRV
tara:strand:+ start:706 stop:924 length:219 start_codon:yes stop_codon:yes gene_type:complete